MSWSNDHHHHYHYPQYHHHHQQHHHQIIPITNNIINTTWWWRSWKLGCDSPVMSAAGNLVQELLKNCMIFFVFVFFGHDIDVAFVMVLLADLDL